MPCRCEDDGEAYARIHKMADAATRAACDLRTILRRGGTEADLTEETREWVAQHDIEDAMRIAAETATGERKRVKAAAKAKHDDLIKSMTLEERRVLGL